MDPVQPSIHLSCGPDGRAACVCCCCCCWVQDAKELQNVEILKNSPYVNPGSKRTPYAQQAQQKAHASYIISPYRWDVQHGCCGDGGRAALHCSWGSQNGRCLGLSVVQKRRAVPFTLLPRCTQGPTRLS